MNKKGILAVILAGGLGKRFKSALPKPFHYLLGKKLVEWVIDSVKNLVEDIVLVVSPAMKEKAEEEFPTLKIAVQKEPLGTANAFMSAKNYFKNYNKVLVLPSDTPLLEEEVLRDFIERSSGNSCLGVKMDNPTGYGRIKIDKSDNLLAIVEEKDASEKEKKINLVNSGIYFLNTKNLEEAYSKIDKNNAQGEEYLTDLVVNLGDVKVIITEREEILMGVNDRYQLLKAEKILLEKQIKKHSLNGVRFILPETVYIEPTVEIGKDVVIGPNVVLRGKTEIKRNCVIMNSHLENAFVDEEVNIMYSVVKDSKISKNTNVGPFAHLRNNAEIGNNCRVGNFVEIKNSKLENDVKTAHLAYIGDAFLGENTNIGAGTITCNFDGVNKHKTYIGKNVFVGSNSTLVAPVKLEDESFIAAGSVITKDVKKYQLAIARSKQENKDNWVLKWKKRKGVG